MSPTTKAPGRAARHRVVLGAFGIAAVCALALAACTPEPPPADPAPAEPVVAPNPVVDPAPTTTTAPAPSNPAVCTTAGGSAEAAPVPTPAAPVDYVAVTEAPDGQREVHTFSADSPADRQSKVDEIARNDKTVLSVGPDTPVHALDSPLPAIDDPVYLGPPASPFGPQWQIGAVGYQAAWGAGLDQGAGIRVAVIDTGVQANHEDLAGAVVAGTDFVSASGDGRTDMNSHGTHVAGIIGARDNAVGGIGGAPQVTIVPVRVLDASGGGLNSDVVSGIIWAADPNKGNADIINLSLGTTNCTQAIYDALSYAASQGVVVVAAGGNCSCTTERLFPAAFAPQIPGMLAVAATTLGNGHASYSDVASYVSISAPGGGGSASPPGIWSTVPPNTVGNQTSTFYQVKSGTSMASPGVAAAAALVKAKCPSYTPAQVANRLVSTAQDLGAPGRDSTFGAGLVRADLAVAPAC